MNFLGVLALKIREWFRRLNERNRHFISFLGGGNLTFEANVNKILQNGILKAASLLCNKERRVRERETDWHRGTKSEPWQMNRVCSIVLPRSSHLYETGMSPLWCSIVWIPYHGRLQDGIAYVSFFRSPTWVASGKSINPHKDLASFAPSLFELFWKFEDEIFSLPQGWFH